MTAGQDFRIRVAMARQPRAGLPGLFSIPRSPHRFPVIRRAFPFSNNFLAQLHFFSTAGRSYRGLRFCTRRGATQYNLYLSEVLTQLASGVADSAPSDARTQALTRPRSPTCVRASYFFTCPLEDIHSLRLLAIRLDGHSIALGTSASVASPCSVFPFLPLDLFDGLELRSAADLECPIDGGRTLLLVSNQNGDRILRDRRHDPGVAAPFFLALALPPPRRWSNQRVEPEPTPDAAVYA